jgi:ABC-type uncharacterized transport system fused permease/ATPase subunit
MAYLRGDPEQRLRIVRSAVAAVLHTSRSVHRWCCLPRYLTQMLQMRCCIWLTRHYLDRWMGEHVYYHMEIGEQRPDNPDQRLADDRLFTFNTLDLALGVLSSAVTLVSFVAILWVISGPLVLSVGSVPIEYRATWSGWRCDTRSAVAY